MLTKYVLPILAVAGVILSVYTVIQAKQLAPASQPIVEPPTRPKKVRMIAGSGLVEARRENIPIGVNVPGVVTEIFVKKGEKVPAGAPLFRVDDRDLQAMLKIRQAELVSSKAELHKLQVAPRPEDIPPARAMVQEALAKMNDAEAVMARTERLFQKSMVAASDFDKDRYAFEAAKAVYGKAKADLERTLAGTWKEDLEVAKAAVLMAQSQIESIKINLDRLTVRAPMEGEILQLNVRLGQFAALTWKEPMIVLGDSNRLHVRVDIDENDLTFFRKGTEAVATLKGRPSIRFPLKFVYVEPYVVPKQSLTGYNSERVDTRVLQAIYELAEDRPSDVYIGQQMDVYLRVDDSTSPEPAVATPGPDLNPIPTLPFEENQNSTPVAPATSKTAA
jgi:multidrug resistance efflux pump